jgi:hypothetical protein
VRALEAALAARFPHTLARLGVRAPGADGEPSADATAIAAELCAWPGARGPLDDCFARFVAARRGADAWLPDLARLEAAVASARALRGRLGRALADGVASGRLSFDLGRGESAPVRANRALPPVALAHALPLGDFPLHLSSRPPATWDALQEAHPIRAAVGIGPAPPHGLSLRALSPLEAALYDLADGRPLAALLDGASDRAAARAALAELTALGLVARVLDGSDG